MEEEKDYNELEDFNINQKNRNNCLSKKQLIYIIISSLAIFIILGIIIIIVSIKKSNNNETLKCDPGYFVPEKEKICKKCSLEKCKECYGTENLNFCTSCISSYIPIYLNNSIHICEKNVKKEKGKNVKFVIKQKINVSIAMRVIIFQMIVKKDKNAKNVVLKIVKSAMEIKIQIFVFLVGII